jgi:hypothetical protein
VLHSKFSALRQARNRPLVEQPGGEFPPAIPTTRTGDAPVPADVN